MTESLPKEIEALLEEQSELGPFTWEDAALVDALLSLVAAHEEVSQSRYRFVRREAIRQGLPGPVKSTMRV